MFGLFDEYFREGNHFQKWIAIYDIEKKKLELQPSTLKSNRFDFIYNTNLPFVVYFFECDKFDLTENNATVFSHYSIYFKGLSDVLLILE